jgi:hypothetical protein
MATEIECSEELCVISITLIFSLLKASNNLLEDFGPNGDVGPSSSGRKRDRPGSMLLADVLQESLIFDQYDRTVREQDQILQKNIDIIAKQKEQGRA